MVEPRTVLTSSSLAVSSHTCLYHCGHRRSQFEGSLINAICPVIGARGDGAGLVHWRPLRGETYQSGGNKSCGGDEMRYKASLTSCVILLLVMQLVLRSGTPILAVRSVPAVTAPPAIELSDLAFTTRAAQVPSASDGSGIHHYFVPFDDRDLWNLFEGKASCHFADAVDVVHACLPLLSNIFVTAGADGTRLYYDHWEDGYDDWQDWDNGSPVISSTTITDTLDAGATRMFRQRILVTEIGQGPPYYYDGRDRITILGEDANVVRLANVGGIYRDGRDPSCRPQGGGGAPNSDSWLAAAWEVLEVADWGTAYNAIVGEDLDYSGGVPDDHDYAGLSIMAAQNGTEV